MDLKHKQGKFLHGIHKKAESVNINQAKFTE